MYRIVLMRHGESARSLEDGFAGRMDGDVKSTKRYHLADPEAIAAAMSAVANQDKVNA